MKALLVAEYRSGELRDCIYELVAFARQSGAESAIFLVGSNDALPKYEGTIFLAEASKYGEYNPEVHKILLLDVINKLHPDLVVFSHSSYGWDLAPRISLALGAAHISEVIEFKNGIPVTPVCNAKLRREIKVKTDQTVLTLQSGAFVFDEEPKGQANVIKIDTDATSKIEFCSYLEAELGSVDLSKVDVIVGAGRGVGKSQNLELIKDLAKALGGEFGVSRPIVDSEWVERSRQIGTTGQTVSPKLYLACGISGAIQHLAGIKKSEYLVAINTDPEAPISEVADVMIVADIKEILPLVTQKIANL